MSRCHCLSGQFVVASIVSVEDVFVERVLTFHVGKCFHPAGAFVVEDAVSTHDAVSSKGFGGFKESHLLSVGVVETMLGVDAVAAGVDVGASDHLCPFCLGVIVKRVGDHSELLVSQLDVVVERGFTGVCVIFSPV